MHDAMKAYHESWERELDRQFLKNDRYRKRAYICSPLSGSTAEEELSNIWRARAYMLYAAPCWDTWHVPPTPICPCSCVTM